MEITPIPFDELNSFDPGEWIGNQPEAWFFRGEDRIDWPDWLKGHNGTAFHMPYGFDGPFYLTCRHDGYTVLAPPGFWIVLNNDGGITTLPPEGAVQLGYVAAQGIPLREDSVAG